MISAEGLYPKYTVSLTEGLKSENCSIKLKNLKVVYVFSSASNIRSGFPMGEVNI